MTSIYSIDSERLPQGQNVKLTLGLDLGEGRSRAVICLYSYNKLVAFIFGTPPHPLEASSKAEYALFIVRGISTATTRAQTRFVEGYSFTDTTEIGTIDELKSQLIATIY